MRMIHKLLLIVVLSVLTATACAKEPTDQEKLDRVYRNFAWIFLGEFVSSTQGLEVIEDMSLPGNGYVVRDFKVEKVLKAKSDEKLQSIKVLVPAALMNIDLTKHKAYYQQMYAIESELESAFSEENDTSTERAELDLELEKISYVLYVHGLVKHHNYDYSLVPGTKYFLAFRKMENEIFSLQSDPDKLVPFGKGFFVDVLLQPEAGQLH